MGGLAGVHDLMSRKPARQSLDFDSPPRQSAKYRHPQFTPPRHVREQIPATQDDDEEFERDSLCSSQTGSTRIRLQEKWRVFRTKDKATNSLDEIKEWIDAHGRAEMAKAGQYEDLRPAPSDAGGFKRVHVSQYNNFILNNFCKLNHCNGLFLCRVTDPPRKSRTAFSIELSTTVPIGLGATAI